MELIFIAVVVLMALCVHRRTRRFVALLWARPDLWPLWGRDGLTGRLSCPYGDSYQVEYLAYVEDEFVLWWFTTDSEDLLLRFFQLEEDVDRLFGALAAEEAE